MTSGRSMLAMYDVVDARQPGAISSVTQAPPTISRRSSTSVRRPARARYADAVNPLWPAPTTMASYGSGGARLAHLGRVLLRLTFGQKRRSMARLATLHPAAYALKEGPASQP